MGEALITGTNKRLQQECEGLRNLLMSTQADLKSEKRAHEQSKELLEAKNKLQIQSKAALEAKIERQKQRIDNKDAEITNNLSKIGDLTIAVEELRAAAKQRQSISEVAAQTALQKLTKAVKLLDVANDRL